MSKPSVSRTDECVCGETNARNCPVHQSSRPEASRYGFRDGEKIYLISCPQCFRENWSPAVASGQCAWCGFKAKLEDVELTHDEQ